MSQQIITFNRRKHPSDATRSQRRRVQKRREQSARQQRWTDANTMIKFVMTNILHHDEDRHVRDEFEEICRRNARRLKAKQSDEQIVLKAICCGCWSIEDIQDETGFTAKLIRELLTELQRLGKVIIKDNLYRAVKD